MHQDFFLDLHSRAHSLNSLPGFIKRDDELSFAISGNKLRKVAALIPYIEKTCPTCVYIKGSAYSNFVLSMSTALIERQIPFKLLLKRPNTDRITGNYAYLKILVPEEAFAWDHVPEPGTLVLEEGGEHPVAIEGAMSLANSIAQNEEELNAQFSRIIIDAGTGLGAIGLILGAAKLQKPWEIAVFSVVDSPEQFQTKLNHYAAGELPPYTVYNLTHARSFGSVTGKVRGTITQFAQNEGIFLDPLYGAKMLYELQNTQNHLLDERSLIIHSGGALSLSGFLHPSSKS